MAIIITNKKRTFSVARPSRLGNPFIIGKHGDRTEVIAKYKIWLDEQIENKNAGVCYCLNEIYKAALTGDVFLECWCAGCGDDCHARIIKEVVLAKAKSNSKIDLICKDRSGF
jgi:hypothetical protein